MELLTSFCLCFLKKTVRQDGVYGAVTQIPLEIRLYRCALVRKAAVRLLWRKLETGEVGG